MRLQAVKGTFDILPDDQPRWSAVAHTAGSVLRRAGVREITPPVFEFTEVFTKSVGDSADLVVQKEMYTFEDRGGRSVTLRPELTAGVMRAYIEHGMHTWPTPVKLYTVGPAFRAENVQRGRFRQFHQVNCELLGLSDPLIDAEAVSLLMQVLEELGLQSLNLKLGSVGDPEDRTRYNAYLRDALAPHAETLSETSRERLRLNPMRILDSKDERDRELIRNLKRPLDFLGTAASEHFAAVRAYLDDWGVPYEIDPAIVRGLDYYRRTAFEVHHGAIGAQSALGGGGRYDGLVESLGGPSTPGVGWAFGIERILDALAAEGVDMHARPGLEVFLVPMDEDAVGEVAKTAHRLRRDGVAAAHAYVRRNPGKGLRDADRAGAVFAALRGSAERQADTYQVKHLASGDQTEVAAHDLDDFVRRQRASTDSEPEAPTAQERPR